MSVPLILVLVTPLAGAVLAPAFGDVAVQRRLLSTLCAAVALGGSVWAVVRTVSGSAVTWRGFALDPWRALLVFGAAAASAAAITRAEDAPRPGATQAAIFAATAAGIAPLALGSSYLLAITLPLSTAGIALVSFVASTDPLRALRSARAVAVLAASDALALVALGLAIEHGTALPPRLSTAGAGLLLAAAIIRLGLAPVAGPAHHAARAHPALGLLWLGPVRAQGFLLAVLAIGAHRGVAYAAAAAAALSIVVAGTMTSPGSGELLPSLGTGVAVLGFALGGAIPTWGGVLALTAAFAGPVAAAAGGAWSSFARTTLAAVPAGGLIAGSALILGAVFGAAATEPWFFALALPATGGLVAATGSVWTAYGEAGFRGPAAILAGSIGVALGLSLAAVPERATSWLAIPVARTLGVGRLLSVGSEHGFSAGLAVIVLATAAIAWAIGPGKVGDAAAGTRRVSRLVIVRLDWWAGAAGPMEPGVAVSAAGGIKRWAIAGTAIFAVAIGLAARVYVAAAGRGFL